MSNGDWINYTIMAEDGTYDVKVYAFDPKNERLSLSFDNEVKKTDELVVETGEWQKYEPFVMENLKLMQANMS